MVGDPISVDAEIEEQTRRELREVRRMVVVDTTENIVEVAEHVNEQKRGRWAKKCSVPLETARALVERVWADIEDDDDNSLDEALLKEVKALSLVIPRGKTWRPTTPRRT